MRSRSLVLVAFLLLQSISMIALAEGRATTMQCSVQKFDWLSHETVVIDVLMSSPPNGVQLQAQWVVYDESGIDVLNGTVEFQAIGSTDSIQIPLKHFFNGDHYYRVEVLLKDNTATIIAQDEIQFTMFQNSKLPQISNLLVFGDSLSDMGNAKASWLNVPDVPPYWQGRFSNGAVWVEYLSTAYSVNTTIGASTQPGDNRAFGGAQTGQGYAYLVLPNVGAQITEYLANVQSTIPANTVISLWAGGNDFLYGSANANTIVANMESHIRALATAGADEFIVPNLPPLETTPEVSGKSQSQQTVIANEVQLYNTKLANMLVNLSAELSITFHSIDAYSIFNSIVQNKQALGLTNVQDAACSGGASLLPLPICNAGDTIAQNADEYLFFDKAHPTRVMHRFIGRYAIEAIGEADTDGDGIIDQYDNCAWTEDMSTLDLEGCSWAQRDDDSDDVNNGNDLCPNTISDEEVDSNGCSAEQRDSDEDGLNDAIDPCPFSQSSPDHDLDGCEDEVDIDDDNDGHFDDEDNCPKGLIGIHSADLDDDGCHDLEDDDEDGDGLSNSQEDLIGTDSRNPDSDGDLVIDGEDAFPLDPLEWADTDGDGCGDNGDAFPLDDSECLDYDEDGFGDNQDVFPYDESEWLDSDGDGFGDNRDGCPSESGSSLIPQGCPDRDGDGFGDIVDLFPNDPEDWADMDNDSVGDNRDLFPTDPTDWADRDNDSYGDNRDVFPSDANEWNDTDGDGVGDNADVFPTDSTEWYDSDLDGCGDNSDVWPNDPEECGDRDYDGIGDNADAFPDNTGEWSDIDGDGLGDNSDQYPTDPKAKYDSDGDGIADAYDMFPDTSTMNNWFDVAIRVVGFSVLIGALFLVLKRKNPPITKYTDWQQLQNI
ncbi:MAG: SGNH/GDSL hydrolase family protein [archaeon]|nr:SGNH/GDSL hydrolase family protein [archaeon]